MNYAFPTAISKPPKLGIYGISNRESGKIYIGSAIDMASRWRNHRYDLNRNKHRNQYLQNAFQKCPDKFEFFVIEEIKHASMLIEREQFWLNFYKSYVPDYGYNIALKAGSSLGLKRSAEFRKRKSKMHSGRPQPWLRKPIVKMDLSGAEIYRFESISEASRSLGFDRPIGNLISAMNGQQKTAYGFKWRRA